MDDKIVLTGIKPTGTPHIGNYIGALKPLIDMSQNHKTVMFIADLHALNAIHDAKEIKKNDNIIYCFSCNKYLFNSYKCCYD